MSDVPSGKAPIFESVGAGYGYLGENWSRWLPAAVLFGVVMGLIMLRYPHAVLQDPAHPQTMDVALVGMIPNLLLLVATTGMFRHALNNDFIPPIGVTLGAPELRVIGVMAGLFLIFAIVVFFVVFVLFMILGGAAAQMGLDLENADPEAMGEIARQMMNSGGAWVLILFSVVFFCAILFVYIRLLFVQAATVAEGRMMAFAIWGLTKGNWWRIFACVLLIAIPVGLVGGVVTSIFELALLGDGADASGLNRFLYGQAVGMASMISQIPMVGLLAYLYRGLRPGEAVDNVFK